MGIEWDANGKIPFPIFDSILNQFFFGFFSYFKLNRASLPKTQAHFDHSIDP